MNFQIKEDALISEAISVFLERRISSCPIVDSHGKVITVLSKSDIMNELVKHPANYLEILDIPAMVSLILDKIKQKFQVIAGASPPPPLLTTTMTVFETIAMLVSSERQSLVSLISEI